MSDYGTLISQHLSCEVLEQASNPDAKPTPVNDGTLGVKIKFDKDFPAGVRDELAQYLYSDDSNLVLTAESHDPTLLKDMLPPDGFMDDNYVVNGTCLPDYIGDTASDIRVSLIKGPERVSELKSDTIYYVMMDFNSEDVIEHLAERGFTAVDNPLDLGREIHKARLKSIQQGK